MTDVRTFQAATIQEALGQIRAELGDGAVILKTREVAGRRKLPWRKPASVVEVTVCLDSTLASPIPFADEVEEALGTPLSSGSLVKPHAAPPSSTHEWEIGDDDIPAVVNRLRGYGEPAAESAIPEKRTPPFRVENSSPSTEDLMARLEAMERMIQQLGQSHQASGSDVPEDLFSVYTDLIDREVEGELARELIGRLKKIAAADELADREFARIQLQGMVEGELHCGQPIQLESGRRKIVGLVGPTGVGKTTTIAKLAANFRIRDGIRMGLVTVDTYRIAAVEQLRTYAEIIDLPMKVVTSPQEMRRAIDELSGLDLVLVDTAGRSPHDDLKLQELRSLFAEAQVDEVQLVLSMTASRRNLAETARKFMAAQPTSMIATKLDEAAGLGALLSLNREFQLPISYVTTGQAVPDDIEPANASRLSRLILGQDTI